MIDGKDLAAQPQGDGIIDRRVQVELAVHPTIPSQQPGHDPLKILRVSEREIADDDRIRFRRTQRFLD